MGIEPTLVVPNNLILLILISAGLVLGTVWGRKAVYKCIKYRLVFD